jgi:hypothetical protein
MITNDPIQDYILKNERNLSVAFAIGETWPKTRAKIVAGFLGKLESRLKKILKGWKYEQYKTFFTDAYGAYYFWKPAWENRYAIGLQCYRNGIRMDFGVERDKDKIGKRPYSDELLSAITRLHPSAQQNEWWEATIKMRNPAPDWRKPEVLWRMHTDAKFLEDVAEQLLNIAKISEPIIDRLVRNR